MTSNDQAAQTDLRCKKCLGRGYLISGRPRGGIKTHNCARCRGSGEVQPGQRNPESNTPLRYTKRKPS